MLTKKDYKAIAEMVVLCRIPDITLEMPNHQEFVQGINAGVADLSHRLAEYFEQDNPKFDKQRFYDACFKD